MTFQINRVCDSINGIVLVFYSKSTSKPIPYLFKEIFMYYITMAGLVFAKTILFKLLHAQV